MCFDDLENARTYLIQCIHGALQLVRTWRSRFVRARMDVRQTTSQMVALPPELRYALVHLLAVVIVAIYQMAALLPSPIHSSLSGPVDRTSPWWTRRAP